MQKTYDCIILGAGIVGIATALKIQERGRSVLLVDKGEAGAATSYGNAGIIEQSSIFPHAFPQALSEILSVVGNKRLDVRFHWKNLLSAAPFLYRYWRASSPERASPARPRGPTRRPAGSRRPRRPRRLG